MKIYEMNGQKFVKFSALQKVIARWGTGLIETRPECAKVVKRLVESIGEKIDDNYGFDGGKVSEIEHESRDGFISSNDGGYHFVLKMPLGFFVENAKVPAKMTKYIKDIYKINEETILQNNKHKIGSNFKGTTLKELAKVNKKLAEELSEDLLDIDDDSVLAMVSVMYSNPSSINVQVVLNWNSPYHREDKEMEIYYQEDFEFENEKDLEKQLKMHLDKGFAKVFG